MSIQILLSTFNGEKYLHEQIESILQQKSVDFSILVRDDESRDSTCEILNSYQEQGILRWYEGRNLKSAHSFFDLILHADFADFYALSDQDDYWINDKLDVAIEALSKFEDSKPALYFSKAKCVDEKLEEIKGNRYPKNALSFGTALLQNNVTGCTLVFNRALLQLLRQGIPATILMHDHWIYLVCKAFDGNVIYDPSSHILYRQHGNNVIGSNSNPLDRFKKSGFFDNNRIRSKIAFELISIYGINMPKEQRITTYMMVNYRDSLKNKWNLICNPEIKTHRLGTDILLIVNILFNKV